MLIFMININDIKIKVKRQVTFISLIENMLENKRLCLSPISMMVTIKADQNELNYTTLLKIAVN